MPDELEVSTMPAMSFLKSDCVKERLQRHARSFDGLLSLIPAKLYYGEDVSVCIPIF